MSPPTGNAPAPGPPPHPDTGVWMFPDRPAPRLVEAIRLAERLGLDEMWLGDEGPAREPFTVLAAAAPLTSTIGLGVGITNPYVRHPALAVTSALTIHELSGGRVRLGVGAGGQLSLGPFGLTARRTVENVEAFVETARAVADRRPGPGYTPADLAVDATVAGRPMPIYVGGRGPRMNRLASRAADGAFVAGLPPFRYDEVIGWAREVRPIAIALYPSVAFDEAAIEHHRPEMIWSLLDAPAEVASSMGLERPVLLAAADELRRGNRAPAAALVTDDLLPRLLLVGSPGDVGRRLAELVVRHRPDGIGLAVLQPDVEGGIADAAEAFAAMRAALAGSAA